MRGAAIRIGLGILALGVASCAHPPPPPEPPAEKVVLTPPSPLRPYPDRNRFLQCVPFARAVSGVDIHGDAWTWWEQAAGRFERGSQPRAGAVLVFRRTGKLKLGHVAVVAQIAGAREILVTHANWGSDGETRGVVHERQPLLDVSPTNDWTQVRLQNRTGQWGNVYPTHGFIYQPGESPTVTSSLVE